MMGTLFVGVFLLVWSAAVFVMDFKTVGILGRDRAASGHPTASAMILRSEVESNSDAREASQYAVTYNHPFKVAYSYQVNGREYVGDKFHHGMHAGGLKAALVIQSLYPVGSRVNVHYNPADPSDSVMTTGLGGADLLALMCMTPFNVLVVAGWLVVVAFMAGLPPATPSHLGCPGPVTRLPGEGGEVRLRLAHARPVAVFLWTLAGASFGMVFVVMSAFDGDVDLAGMTLAWVAVLAGAVGFAVRQARRIAAGRYDFRVDRLRGTLALPPGFDRKTDTYKCSTDVTGEVALARIVDIRVASREKIDSDGNRIVYYEPVIHLDDVAEKAKVALTTQTTEEYAKEIVQALRREVGLLA